MVTEDGRATRQLWLRLDGRQHPLLYLMNNTKFGNGAISGDWTVEQITRMGITKIRPRRVKIGPCLLLSGKLPSISENIKNHIF